MAPNEVSHLTRPAVRPRDIAAQGRFERIPAESGVGRAFGFLVHDVSRLIKRRFERRARQMGLAITRQQAAVILNIAGNEGVSQAEVATWLGIAIVGGLLLSQWLTLYTTPVIYLYLERLARWLGRPYRPSRVQEALSDTPRPALAEGRHGGE